MYFPTTRYHCDDRMKTRKAATKQSAKAGKVSSGSNGNPKAKGKNVEMKDVSPGVGKKSNAKSDKASPKDDGKTTDPKKTSDDEKSGGEMVYLSDSSGSYTSDSGGSDSSAKETPRKKKKGCFYEVFNEGDVRVFTGPKAAENLGRYLEKHGDANVVEHGSIRALLKSRAERKEGERLDQLIKSRQEKERARQNTSVFSTPPRVAVKAEPTVTPDSKCGVEVNSSIATGTSSTGSSSETVDISEVVDCTSAGNPKVDKPDISNLVNSSYAASAFGASKIEVRLVVSPTKSIDENEEQAVVFFQFVTNNNGRKKPYWAMKPDLISCILGSLEEQGKFDHQNQYFRDIKKAQLRAQPHGPNTGLTSLYKGERYPVEVCFFVLKRNRASLLSLRQEVTNIGKRIKAVVSAEWFRSVYMTFAEENASPAFAKAVTRPNEKFFTMLKRGLLTLDYEITLDHLLMDEGIEDVAAQFEGDVAPTDWTNEFKTIAYKSGISPHDKKKQGSDM